MFGSPLQVEKKLPVASTMACMDTLPAPTITITQPTEEDQSKLQVNVECGPVTDTGVYDLGVNHFQCFSARNASAKIEATSISADATFGKQIPIEIEQIGSLNAPGDKKVSETFHGARTKRGGDTVNQSITLSVDPESLICLSCSSRHHILEAKKTIVVMLSDQNFLSMWPNTVRDKCVLVVRICNPSLTELLELLFEILDRNNLADGSLVMIGATSYLHRIGTSCYSREWTRIVARAGRKWPNVRIAPLIPLVRESCLGGVARELIELASWHCNVYAGRPEGFMESWNLLVTKTIERSAGQTVLNSPEHYTLSLPLNLDPNSPDKPSTFLCTSSRPSVLYGIEERTVGELLDSIKNTLNRDFNISVEAGV